MNKSIAFCGFGGLALLLYLAYATLIQPILTQQMIRLAPDAAIVLETRLHAERRHSGAIDAFSKCLGTGSSVSPFYNPNNGRWYFPCFDTRAWIAIDSGKADDDPLVTVFDRSSAKSLLDILKWFRDLGYRTAEEAFLEFGITPPICPIP